MHSYFCSPPNLEICWKKFPHSLGVCKLLLKPWKEVSDPLKPFPRPWNMLPVPKPPLLPPLFMVCPDKIQTD